MKEIFIIQTGPRLRDKLFFRVAHPLVPTLLFAPVALLLILLVAHFTGRAWYNIAFWFFIGILAWTFIEYLLHRFVFHWNPATEPWKTFTSSLHLAHHRDPQDPFLVFPPMLASLLFSSIFFFVFLIISLSIAISTLMIAGVSVAYIIYEWFHYGAHNFKPKSKAIKYMQHHHLYHHFKRPKQCYGVTNPFWDKVFGTHNK